MQLAAFLRNLAAGAVWAALGFAAAMPLLVWGSDKAPEFYGAFTAAIVAAIAVVLGAHYQAELTRRRDDAIARREQIAEAADLLLWLHHAIGEMEFIAQLMSGFRKQAMEAKDSKLEMTIDRYREMVSSQFMDELRDRAKMAARLSLRLGAIVAPALYGTFLAADRIYRFRGAAQDWQFGLEQIDQHIFVTNGRIAALRKAQAEVAKFLEEQGTPPIMLDD